MSKKLFYRIISIFMALVIVIIEVPSVFKDFLFLCVAAALFFSTFDLRKKKKLD